ncbi:MAG: SGNH/GDSL hydrolase family protein [Parvularculaceae bacterium]
MKFMKTGLWLMAAGLYAGLFAEAFLRVISPQAFIPRYVTAAPYGVRMNEPSRTYQQHTPEVSALIEVNAQGLRARHEYSVEKPKGVKRIALFGDSYFLGFEVNLEDSFAWQLEQQLRARKCPVEVLNFAVSGFGTAEMLRTLEQKGLNFEPDVVLFSWHHTDPADNIRSGLYRFEEQALEATGANYIPTVGMSRKIAKVPFYKALSNNSHAFTALREKIGRLAKNILTGGAVVTKTSSKSKTHLDQPADRPPASALDLALIERSRQVSREANAAFYLIDIPTVQSRTWFRSGFRLLPETLVAADYTISALPRFDLEKSTTQKLYWEKGHRHLTPKGNLLLAEEVASKIYTDQSSALACQVDSR